MSLPAPFYIFFRAFSEGRPKVTDALLFICYNEFAQLKGDPVIMRRYVSRKDLVSVLNDLLEKKDPYVREVYREVMLYRFSKNPLNPEKVELMLNRPKHLSLCVLDLVVLCSGFLFLSPISALLSMQVMHVLVILLLCIAFELLRLQQLIRTTHKYLPYIFIDELISRKILVVSSSSEEAGKIRKPHTAK